MQRLYGNSKKLNLLKMKESNRYAWYVVGLLTLANISSFIDRQILSLLVKPIKRDLHLSDTQVSLLMGLSFALFYTFLALSLVDWLIEKVVEILLCWV